WEVVMAQSEVVRKALQEKEIVKVSYSDPYLASPLPVVLVSRVLDALAERSTNTGPIPLEILTLKPDKPYNPRSRSVSYNWFLEEEPAKTEFMEALFSTKYDGVVLNQEADKSKISHARS